MKYKPIKYFFYDILEATAILRKTVEIKYYFNDSVFSSQPKIKNIYSREGEGVMELDTRIIIRLDQIVSVDNYLLKEFC